MASNQGTIAINYNVVANQVTEMNELVSKAQTLQSSLSQLHSELQTNWTGSDSAFLLQNYDDFVANIDTIKSDITKVAEWCNATTAEFKNKESENRDRLASAMMGH